MLDLHIQYLSRLLVIEGGDEDLELIHTLEPLDKD